MEVGEASVTGEWDNLLPPRVFATDRFPSKRLNVYSRMEMLLVVRDLLKGTEEWDVVRNSCFGALFDLPTERCSVSCKLIHALLTRSLVTKKKYSMWTVFGGQPFRFALKDFEAVTGLPCGEFPQDYDPEEQVHNKDIGQEYWDRLFGLPRQATLGDVVQLLRRGDAMTGWRRVRLAMLLIVDGVLIASSQNSKPSPKYVRLTENIHEFMDFPWGRESFFWTIRCMIPGKKVSTFCQQLQQESLRLVGFPLGLQLVALRAVPAFLEKLPPCIDAVTVVDYPGNKLPPKALTGAEVLDVERMENLVVHALVGSGCRDKEWDEEIRDKKVIYLEDQISRGHKFVKAEWPGGDTSLPLNVPVPKERVGDKRGLRTRSSSASKRQRVDASSPDACGDLVSPTLESKVDLLLKRVDELGDAMKKIDQMSLRVDKIWDELKKVNSRLGERVLRRKMVDAGGIPSRRRPRKSEATNTKEIVMGLPSVKSKEVGSGVGSKTICSASGSGKESSLPSVDTGGGTFVDEQIFIQDIPNTKVVNLDSENQTVAEGGLVCGGTDAIEARDPAGGLVIVEEKLVQTAVLVDDGDVAERGGVTKKACGDGEIGSVGDTARDSQDVANELVVCELGRNSGEAAGFPEQSLVDVSLMSAVEKNVVDRIVASYVSVDDQEEGEDGTINPTPAFPMTQDIRGEMLGDGVGFQTDCMLDESVMDNANDLRSSTVPQNDGGNEEVVNHEGVDDGDSERRVDDDVARHESDEQRGSDDDADNLEDDGGECLSDSPVEENVAHVLTEGEKELWGRLAGVAAVDGNVVLPETEPEDYDFFEETLKAQSKVKHSTRAGYEFDNNFLLALGRNQGWFSTMHMEVLMAYLGERHEHLLAEQRLCFASPWLTLNIQGKWRAFSKAYNKDRVAVDDKVKQYVTAADARWVEKVDTVYAPMMWADSHWVGLSINLPLWSLEILDPNPCKSESMVKEYMKPVVEMLPYIIRKLCPGTLTQMHGVKPFSWTREVGLYKNERIGDCGPVAAKWMEVHALGGHPLAMDEITHERVVNFRKKYAMDVYKDWVVPLYRSTDGEADAGEDV